MSVKSKGTVLQLSIASVFTALAGIFAVSTSGSAVGTYDDTTLDQAGAGRTHSPTGYAEGGSVSFSQYFDPVAATVQALTDLITTPAVSSWKIIWSDTLATEWPFSGILTKYDVAADRDNALIGEGEIKISGIVTYPT